MKKLLLATSAILVSNAGHAMPLQHGLPGGQMLSMIGVDTHLEYTDGFGMYADTGLVGSALQYLGISHIRDGVPTPGNQSLYAATASYDVLTNAPYNIKVEMILPDYTRSISYDRGLLDALFTTPGESGSGTVARGSIVALEGLNEINNQNPEPSSATATTWQDYEACLAKSYSFCGSLGVAVDSNVSGAAVVEFTGNTSPITPTSAPSMSFPATAGNVHPYLYANQTQLPFTVVQNAFAETYDATPAAVNSLANQAAYPTGLVMSESGTNSSAGGGDTPSTDPYYAYTFDDRHMAVRDLQTILDGVALGSNVFLYQLFANYTFGQSSDENYGLFRYAGTDDGKPTDTPTTAATAIHQLTGILAGETSRTGTDCIEWNNPAAPQTEHTLLVQTGDGAFRIIVWNEGTDWNEASHAAVAQTTVGQSLTFAYPVSGYVENLISGAKYPFATSNQVYMNLGDSPQVAVITSSAPSDDNCGP